MQLVGVLVAIWLIAAMTPMIQSFLGAQGRVAQAHTSDSRDTVTNCSLMVPANPLSATGLATPWMLQAPCHETAPMQDVFLQAVIFDPATSHLFAYAPLVIDAGTTPAVAPVPVALPEGAVVGIFGGGNDMVTTLLNKQGCLDGFGQVFFCGTQELFAAINAAHIQPPPLGTEVDGLPCPTTRDFRIVDQDPSDNVQTTYLDIAGQLAQNTALNRQKFPQSVVLENGSDNSLLAAVDNAIGCKPWTIPDLADPGALVPTQATDELQAAYYQKDQALIPAGDPMVGPNNLTLLNEYRLSADQPPVGSLGQANTQEFCVNMVVGQMTWLSLNQAVFANVQAPVFAGGGSLYVFLQNRLIASIQLLGCKVPTRPLQMRGQNQNQYAGGS